MTVNRKRQHQVNLRMDDEEFEALRTRWTRWIQSQSSVANVHAVSLSAYIRYLVLKDNKED